MQSYYEIYVSIYGKYLFSTAPRACVDKNKAEQVFDLLTARFPKDQGYEVSCTYWGCSGTKVTFK